MLTPFFVCANKARRRHLYWGYDCSAISFLGKTSEREWILRTLPVVTASQSKKWRRVYTCTQMCRDGSSHLLNGVWHHWPMFGRILARMTNHPCGESWKASKLPWFFYSEPSNDARHHPTKSSYTPRRRFTVSLSRVLRNNMCIYKGLNSWFK